MTDTPGTLELERARAIYAQFIIDNTPGAGPDDVPRFDDNAHGVRIALAALTEAADEIASLRARVEVLEVATKPFANGCRAVIANYGGDRPDNQWQTIMVQMSAVKALLAATKDTPDE